MKFCEIMKPFFTIFKSDYRHLNWQKSSKNIPVLSKICTVCFFMPSNFFGFFVFSVNVFKQWHWSFSFLLRIALCWCNEHWRLFTSAHLPIALLEVDIFSIFFLCHSFWLFRIIFKRVWCVSSSFNLISWPKRIHQKRK